jgi:signal transduction histidine kinase
MTLSLRSRILMTLLPLLALLALLGGAGIVLLYKLGGRIDLILRENYESVIYMVRLKEAAQKIDASFGLALNGKVKSAHDLFEANWKPYDENLRNEKANITILPGEQELFDELTVLTGRYRAQGTAFYAHSNDTERKKAYEEKGGLKDTFGFAIGLALTALFGILLAWRTITSFLQPIRAMIHSARGIRAGNLDQVVPVVSQDELGQLAGEFNAMARQLRQYRQTGYARLLSAQRTSQATIDSFPDPVLVVDPEGLVEMANPAAQRMLGVSGKQPDQAAGPVWIPPEAMREPLQEALRQQKPYLPEAFDHAVLLRRDGQEHSFLPHIMPISDPFGFTLGAAVLLHDVTRFRLLDQIKSDLVATASHELKTPLTSIRLANHILLEETIGPLTAKQTELLLDARENTERLLAVVNNLLDLARLEQGREYLDLHPVKPAVLLQSAAEAIRPRADDKGLTVAVDAAGDLPLVVADTERFGHALLNLLDNAIVYTDRGGNITLSAQRERDRVILAITDTGIGIPAEYLPHLFDRFFRIPGQTRGAGTGLGLAIVREIVASHGGIVTCTSKPGSGTTFRISLPVAG